MTHPTPLATALAEATFSAEDRSIAALVARFQQVGLSNEQARTLAIAASRQPNQRKAWTRIEWERWVMKRLKREDLLSFSPLIRRWFFARAPPSAPRWGTPSLDDTPSVARWLAQSTGFSDLTRERLVGIAFPRRARDYAGAADDPYTRRWMAKKAGGLRLIEAPRSTLRSVQRALLEHLIAIAPPHEAACGFRRGMGCVAHASRHVDRDVVVRVDLEDFFSSISAARVRGVIRAAGYPPSVAQLISALCTTETPSRVVESTRRMSGPTITSAQRDRLRLRHLPQGAPTSPALSNLVAFSLDARLTGLAQRFGATYSRYADDLVFSGDKGVARHVRTMVAWVTEIARDEGFTVRRDKTRVMTRATRQQVAGLVVNTRVGLSRQERDSLEALLFNCVRHGPASQNLTEHHDFRAHVAGRVAHATHVDSARTERIRQLYAAIEWPTPT